jgi:isoleucyl-tRNA synthetase
MKYENYDFKVIEEDVLAFWDKKKILAKIKAKNQDGKKFYFLQGPPYTSGKLHLGHAWNHALKDMVLRYKRFKGFNVWDRNGYDMHGLPTERKVMAKFNLNTKEDIEKFGIKEFTDECLKYCQDTAKIMDEDIKRVGVTLTYDNPYMPITNNYIEGEWYLIKKAHEKNRLYQGKRTLSWCANCETALSKHECEYQEITDNSIFFKLPLKGKDKEFLIVWTTTPWTVAFNLGVMVNPDLDYVKADVEGEKWYLAKALAGPVIQAVADKKLNIEEEFKGATMEGWEYTHPWENEIKEMKTIKLNHPKTHTVLLSKEYVTTDAGSGLVHTAPGCGPEDYEVGYANNIPPFNNINEQGIFPESMGIFSGKVAKTDDAFFIEQLGDYLIEKIPVEHDYAHCQRCHKPVVFRTTPQWFFKVEDLKEKMLEANKDIEWVPETAKNSFNSWLDNLRDNSITKQRYWGTPIPLWQCDKCNHYEVFGSIAELKEKVSEIPENLHKPHIDKVKYACPKCDGTMVRDPDVLDVWIDAGTASWNCLDFPHNQELIKEWFPADFILEGKDQIRGWFNLLMIASFIALDKPSFKKVYMHGFVTDVGGIKMSKSLGNITSPYEVIDKYGADVLRYYFSQTRAGEDINFSWDEIATKSRNLNILWNLHKLTIDLAKENNIDPFVLDNNLTEDMFNLEEKYIVSKLNNTIKEVTKAFESYHLDEIVEVIEDFYLELSRTYVQMIRDKSVLGNEEDKQVVVYTLTKCIMNVIKMLNTVSPFITEAIYHNFKEEFNLTEESLSEHSWPEIEESKIDYNLEEEINITKQIIQGCLYAREKVQIGLRWPVKEIIVESKRDDVIKAVEELREVIKKQVNAKEITIVNSLPGVKVNLKPDNGALGKSFRDKAPEIIAELMNTSPETILKHLEEDNYYSVKGEYRVTRDMVVIERDVPSNFVSAELKKGFVYLNTERSAELEAEGYAREISRNVQQFRKQSGLVKTDKIKLFVKMSPDMKEMLEKHKDDIKDKVGAERLDFSAVEPVTKHEVHKEFDVKSNKFEIWFNK